MKKFLLLCFLISKVSVGQLLTEDFDYTAGDAITSHGWSAFSSSGTNPITVITPGLTYTGYASSGVGNCVALTTSGEDDKMQFTSQNSGSVYISAMINVSASQTTGDYFLSLYYNSGNSYFCKLWAKKNGSGFDLGISKTTSTSASASWTGSIYSYNSTYLIVMQYTFNSITSTDDAVSLWINPDLSGSEPSATIAASNDGGNDATNISAVALRQGSSTVTPTLQVDGIRVATSWSQAPLPVELTSFTSIVNDNEVTLNWTTATEVNNYGFEIQRIAVSNQRSAWEKIGFVQGHGNSNSTKNYSFTDKPTCGIEFQYRLKQIDFNGAFEYSEITSAILENVNEFKLEQNYPNPFNPMTRISYTLPVRTSVKLSVYDLLAQVIAELVNGIQEAGRYEVTFDGSNLPSGAYFYKLEAGNYVEVKKLLLVK